MCKSLSRRFSGKGICFLKSWYQWKHSPASQDPYWIWDGIHPTPAGHKRMADMWIKRVNL
nr:SGNH/GDSL hydrolase family protein [uncultured Bacteroides sp.]